LDRYISGEIRQISGKFRCDEVTDYLEKHPEIERFVILDDSHTRDFEKNYPEQFVYCQPIFDADCYAKA
jgi:hypothetical protein